MRSGGRALAGLGVGLVLAGCTTTQHTAQRVQLDSARLRAALDSTRVTASNRLVAAASVAVVRDGDSTAFIVTVRNRGRRAVSDLPISVGYTQADSTAVFLNAGTDLEYFQAHLPAIRAGGALTWVYTSDHRLPTGARPFARVGRRPAAPARLTEMNVRIRLRYASPTPNRAVVVHLYNPTGVPQYQLQVYAYALAAGRYVAAGNATVADLSGGAERRLRLPLVGAATSNLQVEAVPTVLQ